MSSSASWTGSSRRPAADAARPAAQRWPGSAAPPPAPPLPRIFPRPAESPRRGRRWRSAARQAPARPCSPSRWRTAWAVSCSTPIPVRSPRGCGSAPRRRPGPSCAASPAICSTSANRAIPSPSPTGCAAPAPVSTTSTPAASRRSSWAAPASTCALSARAGSWAAGGRGGGPPDPRRRAKLAAIAASADGMASLVVELRARDPEGAAALDLGNPRRVIRAVELLRGGEPSLARARRRTGGRRLDLVVLDAERGLHREALTHRLDTMFVGGALLAEVAAELSRGTAPAALRRAGIGCAEALDMIDGRLDVAAASAVAMQRTRRYVKAQRTWFRQEDAALRLQRGPGSTTSGMAEAVLAMIAAGRDPPAGTASLRKFSRKP